MVELLNQWLPNVMDRPDVFIKSIQETFIMVGWSGAISFVVGLFLGVLITVTKPGNILEHPGWFIRLSIRWSTFSDLSPLLSCWLVWYPLAV